MEATFDSTKLTIEREVQKIKQKQIVGVVLEREGG